MNEKQTKKALAVTFIGTYLVIVPMLISYIGTVVFHVGGDTIVSATDIISGVIVVTIMLLSLLFMIYTKEILSIIDKTKIGKWLNTPYTKQRN